MGPQQCLIIVPRREAGLCEQVKSHFAQDPDVIVRFDWRSGDQASREIGVFAVGGGALTPERRAHVEKELRLLRT